MADLETTASRILDEFDTPAALLDADGVVRVVNTAWDAFAVANDCPAEPSCGVGVGYRTWEHDRHDPEARRAAAGVLDVIHGRRPSFQMVYPCHAPTEERWFRLVVEPMADPAPRPVLTVHVRLDDRHGADEYHAVSPPALPVVCAWCGAHERASDGTWAPATADHLSGLPVSHGICDTCVAKFT